MATKLQKSTAIRIWGIVFLAVFLVAAVLSGTFFCDGLSYEERYDSVSAIISEVRESQERDGDTRHTAYVSYSTYSARFLRGGYDD